MLSRKWLRGTVRRRKFVGEMSIEELSGYRFNYGPLWCREFIFLRELISFDEKDFFPLPLVPVSFVSECFYHNLCWYFNWYSLVNMQLYQKSLQICYMKKKDSKYFFEVTKEAERLHQNALVKTPFYRFENWRPQNCVLWIWYFSQQSEEQLLWTSLFLQILQVATKIEIHHILFCRDNLNSKNFKELSLMESLLKIKQDYSLQARTLLNSITDDFMKWLWNSCIGNFARLP